MLSSRASLLVFVVLASIGYAEPPTAQKQMLTAELRAERPNAPGGALTVEQRKYVFPPGCDYVTHDLEVLQEIPKREPNDYRGIFDTLEKRRMNDGKERIQSLNVRISAFRDSSLPPGPLLMVVRLTLTVSCTGNAVEQMLRDTDLQPAG